MPISRTAIGGTLLALVLSTTACGAEEEPTTSPETAEQPPAAEAESEPASFSYEGDTGPEQWAELDATFATCGAGEEQSPIDVNAAPVSDAEQNADPVTYDYTPASFTLKKEPFTIKASAENAGGITLGGERYDLLQFHVHTPSEHTLDGERTELGVHLVHQNADDELAVVQLFFEPGADDGALSEAFSDLPRTESDSTSLDNFDVSTLLPDERTTFRYDGSLTTPPCTENVRWIVMQQAMEGSSDLITDVQDLIGDTARPLQPLNGREVVVVKD